MAPYTFTIHGVLMRAPACGSFASHSSPKLHTITDHVLVLTLKHFIRKVLLEQVAGLARTFFFQSDQRNFAGPGRQVPIARVASKHTNNLMPPPRPKSPTFVLTWLCARPCTAAAAGRRPTPKFRCPLRVGRSLSLAKRIWGGLPLTIGHTYKWCHVFISYGRMRRRVNEPLQESLSSTTLLLLVLDGWASSASIRMKVMSRRRLALTRETTRERSIMDSIINNEGNEEEDEFSETDDT